MGNGSNDCGDPSTRCWYVRGLARLGFWMPVAVLLTTPLAMRARERAVVELARPSPLAFALMVERLREKLSTEKLADRINRMLADLERQLDPSPPQTRRGARRVLR